MTIAEIQERMDAIVAPAQAETRGLKPEEVEAYEAAEQELLQASASAATLKRHQAYKTPIIDSEVVTAVAKPDAELERAFDHFLRTGQKNMDIAQLRAQNEGTPSAGGYLVPPGFRNKLVEVMLSFGGLESSAEVITTDSGNTLEWPTLNDTANVGEIAAEGAAGASGDDLVFGTNSLGAYKYTSLGASNLELQVSVELLQDAAFDVQGLVTRALGMRIGRKMAADFVNGSGSGEPLGIITAASDISAVTPLADNPQYGDLVAMVHAIDPAYRPGAKWITSDGIIARMQALVDANDRPLWNPSTAGMADPLMSGTLLGFPVVMDQAFPQTPVNDENFLIFGDLAQAYIIRHVKDVTVIVDPYTYAKEGKVGFVAWARADGTIQNASAYAQLEGTT